MPTTDHIVGSVAGYVTKREAAANKPPRKKNMRDVVGARQSPSIGDIFGVCR